jgi:hypothetical protein
VEGAKGETGATGSDGVAIVWLGTFDSAPKAADLNNAYYNATDKKSYIWDGDSWEIMVQDGAQGQQGATRRNRSDR